MNTPRLPDDLLAVWIDENNVTLPPATRRAIEVGIGTVRQRRRPMWLPSRRSADMNTYARPLRRHRLQSATPTLPPLARPARWKRVPTASPSGGSRCVRSRSRSPMDGAARMAS